MGACRPWPSSPEGTAMESMPAPAIPVTVGVDTHLETHVAAVIDQTGRLLGTQAFPASTRGYVALITWAEGFGPVAHVGVEGTGTFGAGLTRFVRAYGPALLFLLRSQSTVPALVLPVRSRARRRRSGRAVPPMSVALAAAGRTVVARAVGRARAGQQRHGAHLPSDGSP